MREIAVLAEPQVAPVREIAVFAEAAGGLAEAQVASVREIAVFADVQVAPRSEAPKFPKLPLERKFVYRYMQRRLHIFQGWGHKVQSWAHIMQRWVPEMQCWV